MKRSICVSLSLSISLLLVSVSGAQPHNYQPLDPFGWEWHYESPAGAVGQLNILGLQQVQGVSTVTRRESANGQLLENYWTVSSEGDLFLHGAMNLSFPFVISYAPPVLWLDAPLELGKVWTTMTTYTFDLDGSGPGGTLEISLSVFTAGDVTVPAGTFFAFGVGQYFGGAAAVSTPEGTFDVLGRRIEEDGITAGGDPTEWFVDGLGIAQLGFGDVLQLTSYSSPPTTVEAATWSAIKAHFIN